MALLKVVITVLDCSVFDLPQILNNLKMLMYQAGYDNNNVYVQGI